MKKTVNRRRILLFVLLFLLVIVLRETGRLNFEYYKNNVKSSINYSWQCTSISDTTDYEDEKAAQERAITNNGGKYPVPLKNMSVTAEYDGEKYAITLDTTSKITVHLSTFDPGIIWTPLIKYTSFKATADIGEQIVLTTPYGNRVNTKLHNLNGTLTMNGHLSVIGICSYKEAKKIILQALLKQVAEAARDQLKNLDKN